MRVSRLMFNVRVLSNLSNQSDFFFCDIELILSLIRTGRYAVIFASVNKAKILSR